MQWLKQARDELAEDFFKKNEKMKNNEGTRGGLPIDADRNVPCANAGLFRDRQNKQPEGSPPRNLKRRFQRTMGYENLVVLGGVDTYLTSARDCILYWRGNEAGGPYFFVGIAWTIAPSRDGRQMMRKPFVHKFLRLLDYASSDEREKIIRAVAEGRLHVTGEQTGEIFQVVQPKNRGLFPRQMRREVVCHHRHQVGRRIVQTASGSRVSLAKAVPPVKPPPCEIPAVCLRMWTCSRHHRRRC